jgi:hypothetical protein
MAETKTKPEAKPAAAAPAGLDKKLKHFGTFTNWRGVPHAAYLVWNEEKKGFVAMCAKTHRPFKESAGASLAHLQAHGVKIALNGKTEAVRVAEDKE